mgnify:CR=1 FL=1
MFDLRKRLLPEENRRGPFSFVRKPVELCMERLP